MPTTFSDHALVLKFLAAAMLLVLLPVTVGSATQAIAATALVVLVAVFTLIGVSGELVQGGSSAGVRNRDVLGVVCRQSDPDAAGHVRARAPGAALPST
ncbi:DUF6412 domain-containing protein [Nocardia sp. NPDC052254]|uniref:DUF6412 domain-containing protein n=1 Tax=Nocardia sp. NPDC052254 TaxID=3155681 RepID=UPI00344A0205